ncbi:MAG: amidohydrolase [Rubellimicrobium sp.]|nr:amidohydrolase [Rubellimicrobium sp.]
MTRTLVHNARIRTMDPTRPLAEALLAVDGRILAVGPEAEMVALAGPKATRIDAGGRLVLPGFQDAHIHLLAGGINLAVAVEFYDVLDEATLLARLAAHAKARPDLPLIMGAGWQPGIFGDHNLTARLLDTVVPDRPAVLYDTSFHNCCFNTRALEMAGIDDDTPDPLNGHIVRDADGHATGMLHEEVIKPAFKGLPQLTEEHRIEGYLAAEALAHRCGFTGVLDPRVTEEEAQTYSRVLAEGKLRLRVAGAALVTEADTAQSALERLSAMRAAHPGPDFHVHSAKFFMDGVFENRTAALHGPYADADGGNAPCMFGADKTVELMTALDAARFAIHVHVIGDAATARALDGLEAARRANGPWPAQHQLAHLQLTDPADYDRLAPAGAMANIQPLWARLDPVVPDIALEMIGSKRRAETYAFRKMLNAGADWCLSSDWPVSTLNPFEIMETAVTRQARRAENPREPFLPDQALTIEECVLGYTVNAARACWREHFTGQLRPGFSADLIVLDQDIFDCPLNRISDTRVLCTVFKGQVVWRDPAF